MCDASEVEVGEVCECCRNTENCDDQEDYENSSHSSHSSFTQCEVILFDNKTITGSHIHFVNSRITDTLERGLIYGMYVMQFYMGSQQTYARTKIQKNDILSAKELIRRYPIHVFTHSPVIYNLAGSVKNKSLAWKGNEGVDDMMINLIASLSYELNILDQIDAKGTIIHPGCYILEKGKTQEQAEEDAITAIATTLDKVTYPKSAKILLENSAGEKGKVSYSLSQMIRIREKMIHRENIAYCLDTAHSFGSGLYNLSTFEGVEKMFEEIDRTKARNTGCVELIHLNDSEVPFNAKKDRHALLRTGYIWGEDDRPLRLLLERAGERNIPCVLETSPSDMLQLYELLKTD